MSAFWSSVLKCARSGRRLIGDSRFAVGTNRERLGILATASLTFAGELRCNYGLVKGGMVEVANVVVGFVIALVTQLAVFPRFGLQVSVVDNLAISCIFTVVSILRSFVLRRLFETIRLRAR